MGIEAIEMYCTTSSHLEKYNNLQSYISKSFSSRTGNINPDGDILCIVYVPTSYVGLLVFSVGEMLIITLLCHVRAQDVHDSITTCIKGYHSLHRISDFQFT